MRTTPVCPGNGQDGGTLINYPAGYSNVIGVGATNNLDEKAWFSNHNATVDISAPGLDVYSTMPTYPVALTGFGYNYNQNYDYLSGTSMATPNAAGVAALILSRNPSFGPGKVATELQSTADDKGAVGRDDQYGFGRVNASKAVSNVAISVTSDGLINLGAIGLDETTATGQADKETVRIDTGPANLLIKSSTFSGGGNNWTLASTSGADQVKWDFSTDGVAWTTFLQPDTAYALAGGLPSDSLKDILFRLTMPTATNHPTEHGAQVRIIAVTP